MIAKNVYQQVLALVKGGDSLREACRKTGATRSTFTETARKKGDWPLKTNKKANPSLKRAREGAPIRVFVSVPQPLYKLINEVKQQKGYPSLSQTIVYVLDRYLD